MTKRTRYFMAGSAAVMSAGLGTALVAYYAGGFQPVSASAVSNELRYVPADTALVAYADVRAIMDSELRQRLKEAIPFQEQGQKEFQAETGIDIEHDIDYVVAAATVGSQPTSPLVVARGRFNPCAQQTRARDTGGTLEKNKPRRLTLLANKRAAPADPTAAPVESTKHMALAFLEPGLVAVGDATAVRNAIDAQLTAHSVTSNNEMMELVADIGSGNNAWAVGRVDLITSQGKVAAEISSHLPPVKWFAAAGHINGGLSGSVRVEARDDESADLLRKQLTGLLAFGQMQAQTDPRAKMLVDSLQMTGSGKTVGLTFTVP